MCEHSERGAIRSAVVVVLRGVIAPLEQPPLPLAAHRDRNGIRGHSEQGEHLGGKVIASHRGKYDHAPDLPNARAVGIRCIAWQA